MDKHKALTEIENILFLKENENKPKSNKMVEILNILEELQTYNYRLGKRQGMFKAINILNIEAEKEGRN